MAIKPMMYPPVGPASLAGPPVKPEKYRDSDKSDKQVNEVAYSSTFPSEQI